MKNKHIALIVGGVALSLVGCSAVTTTPIPRLPELPGATVTQTQGQVAMRIVWPEIRKAGYSTLALPGRSQAILLVLKKDGTAVDSTLLKRSQAKYTTTTDGTGAPITEIRLPCSAGANYTVETAVYDSELDGEQVEAHLVASGASQPFEIKSGHLTPIAISLTVIGGPAIAPLAFEGAGRGSELTLSGVNFGTDKALVKANFVSQPFSSTQLEVVSVASTSMKLKLPGNMPIGAGKLNVFVDGVGANALDFKIVDQIKVDTSAALANTQWDQQLSRNVTTLYLVKDATFSVPIAGTYWNNGVQENVASISTQVEVLTAAGAATTIQPVDGVLSLPQGSYKLKFSSGDLTDTFVAESMTLNFTPPATLSYKVSKLQSFGYQDWQQLTLPGFLSNSDTGKQVFLRAGDYNWTYSRPGVVQRDGDGVNNWADTQPNVSFRSGTLEGSTTVTARLKLDNSRVFALTFDNVGLEGFTVPQGITKIPTGGAYEAAVGLRLTDGTITDLRNKWGWGTKLQWSVQPAGLVTFTPHTDDWNAGTATITGGNTVGTGSVTVTYAENPAIKTSFPIDVTDDGSVDLTIK